MGKDRQLTNHSCGQAVACRTIQSLSVHCEEGKEKIENEAFTKFKVEVAILCDIIIQSLYIRRSRNELER